MTDVDLFLEVPFPKVDLSAYLNPLPVIFDTAEFAETIRYFAESGSTSGALLPPAAQALLYTIIRNQRPEQVLEIGTFKGGTTAAMARAVHLNGMGTVHTVGPFDAEHFGANFRHWSHPLQRVVRFYPVNSMSFFMQAEDERLSLDLALVDGNHDYEYATFDILTAARFLVPGGFMFVDNISQVGPFRAAIDFLRENPTWIDCGMHPLPKTFERAFDRTRSNVPNTDFAIFRSPRARAINAIPQTFGNIGWSSDPVNGIRLSTEPSPSGTLCIECILRAFREDRIVEIDGLKVQAVAANETNIEIRLDNALQAEGEYPRHMVETWLTWNGDRPLQLLQPPVHF